MRPSDRRSSVSTWLFFISDPGSDSPWHQIKQPEFTFSQVQFQSERQPVKKSSDGRFCGCYHGNRLILSTGGSEINTVWRFTVADLNNNTTSVSPTWGHRWTDVLFCSCFRMFAAGLLRPHMSQLCPIRERLEDSLCSADTELCAVNRHTQTGDKCLSTDQDTQHLFNFTAAEEETPRLSRTHKKLCVRTSAADQCV